MTLRNIKSLIWMVLCLAALAALSGCQSGSPLDLNDEALSDPQNVGAEQGPIILDEPVLPKDASDLKPIDPQDSKYLQDLLYNLKHIPLVSGDNTGIDPQDYLSQSGNVYKSGDDVVLKSTTGEMAYITYGFRNIPEGEELTRITVRGTMDTQMFNPFGGLYIGVSDYGNGNFRWFGPLGTENEYVLNLWNIDTTNSKQRAYVTLAVYNGDHYTVQDIDVRVGKQFIIPDFDWDVIKLKQYYNEAGILQLHELQRDYFELFPEELLAVK